MRKLALTTLLSLPLMASAQVTGLTKLKLYLGIGGNTYLTETDIPVEAIRYQDGHATPVITKYPAPAAGAISTQPVIAAGLNYVLLTDPATGGPIIAVRPRVAFQAGGAIVPGIPAPTPAAGVRVVKVDRGSIDSRDYLFVPAGGKMPGFSQVMRHEWFVGGPLAATIRYRGPVSSQDDLPALPEAYSTGLSLGLVTGVKHSYAKASRQGGRFYRFPFSYQLPLFMVGANTIEYKKPLDLDNNGRLDSYGDKESRVALTLGTGIGFQFWKIAITPLIGWDFLLGSSGKDWAYQGKIWYGGSVGISLDKLVGLGK